MFTNIFPKREFENSQRLDIRMPLNLRMAIVPSLQNLLFDFVKSARVFSILLVLIIITKLLNNMQVHVKTVGIASSIRI